MRMNTNIFQTHRGRTGLLILLMTSFSIPVFAAGKTEGLAADGETKLRQYLQDLDTEGGKYDRDSEFRFVATFSLYICLAINIVEVVVVICWYLSRVVIHGERLPI